jgi:hypothetical protein
MSGPLRFKVVDQLIRSELEKDPTRTDNDIARIVKCSHGAVRSRRQQHDFPAPVPKRKGVDPDRLNINKEIRALLEGHPGITDIEIVRLVGCNRKTVASNRRRWNSSTESTQGPVDCQH